MAKLLKLRRGTTTQHGSFTGAEGEVTIDTTKDTAVVHDGSTQGGTPLAKEDMSNVSSASIAGRLGTGSIQGTQLENSGVTAGQYGSSSAIPIVTVDAQGLVTAASTTAIDSTTIANGTSNVAVANNGNITTTRSGTARHVVDDAGVHVTGTLDVTGNVTAEGNIRIQNSSPILYLTDTGQNPDYQIKNNNGYLDIFDQTNNTTRFTISNTGELNVNGNANFGNGVDVTGNITGTGDLTIPDSIVHSGDTDTKIRFSSADVVSVETGGSARLSVHSDKVMASVDIKPDADSTRDIGTSSNRFANIYSDALDVSGNITCSGTVDGRDVANDGSKLDELYGGSNQLKSTVHINNGATATTQAQSDNSIKIATTAFVKTAVSDLVDSSPGALNTLNELAAAINDDASFSTTVNNNIATKMPLSGGEFTGNVTCENITPDADSSRNLGSNSVRFANVYADNFYGSAANMTGAFISGMIMMYNSSSPPSGWYLCNGSNGTPDLRDRFIVGAGNSYSHGATGGSNTATDNVNVNVSVSGSTSGGGSYSFVAGIFRAASHTVAASGHQHSFSGSGSGSDTVSIDTRSPYYALTFIMKA